MTHELMSEWVQKAKNGANAATVTEQKKKKAIPTKGNIILEIAEKLRPLITKLFEGKHDANGMLVQPAHVRGIALNVAQELVKTGKYKVE